MEVPAFGGLILSGGSSPDPYYQSDPPKSKSSDSDIVKEHVFKNIGDYARDAVRIFKIPDSLKDIFRKWRSKKVHWYECSNCGSLFPCSQKKYSKTTACSPECRAANQSATMSGRKHTPEAIQHMKDAAKKSWEDPVKARNRREAAKTRKKPTLPDGPHNKGKRTLFIYDCSQCGKKLVTDRKRTEKNQYCSRDCITDSQRRGEYMTCAHPDCEKEIYVPKNKLNRVKRNHCSMECARSNPNWKEKMSEMHMGEKNPNWRGGDPNSEESWEHLSNRIRERDGHSCYSCGEIFDEGRKFAAHHMIPRNEGGPDEDWNLVTLCPSCHPSVDSQEGTAKIPRNEEGIPLVDYDGLMKRWNQHKLEHKPDPEELGGERRDD